MSVLTKFENVYSCPHQVWKRSGIPAFGEMSNNHTGGNIAVILESLTKQ